MSPFFNTLFIPFHKTLRVVGGLQSERAKVHESKLSNGCRLVSRTTLGQPFVEIFVHIDGAGSGAESLSGDKRGVSHVLEHMGLLETENYPEGTINDIVGNEHGYVNAHTTREDMVFKISMPQNKWREALHIIADMVCRPKLTPEAFTDERRLVLGEWLTNKMNAPAANFTDCGIEYFFNQNPFFAPIIGNKPDIQSLRADDLRKFHEREFRSDRTTVFFQGAVTHRILANEVPNLFRFSTPSNNKIETGTTKKIEAQYSLFDIRKPTSEEGVRFSLWFPTKNIFNDYKKARQFAFFRQIFQSRTFSLIRKHVGTYDFHMACSPAAKTPQTQILCTVYPERVESLLSIIGENLNHLANHGDTGRLSNIHKAAQYRWTNRTLDYWRNMTNWTEDYLNFGHSFSLKEQHAAIMEITNKDIQNTAQALIKGGYAFYAEGNVNGLPNRDQMAKLLGMRPPPSSQHPIRLIDPQ